MFIIPRCFHGDAYAIIAVVILNNATTGAIQQRYRDFARHRRRIRLSIRLGVDNGIFAWLDGIYRFGGVLVLWVPRL